MHTDVSSSRKTTPSAYQILLCGGVAGVVAKTFIAPFDRVKIHFQVGSPFSLPHRGRIFGVFHAIKDIYSKSGIYGLYRGHSVMLARIFPYAAINFFAYEKIKSFLAKSDKQTNGVKWYRRVTPGALSGAIAVIFTYPLDILRARLALEIDSKKRRLLRKNFFEDVVAAYKTLKVEGTSKFGSRICGLYQGFVPTLLGIIPYSGVSFFSYELLKSFYLQGRNNEEMHVPSYLKFAFGMISGALGQTAAYPFDLIRRNVQLKFALSHSTGSKPRNAVALIKEIFLRRGLKGFFTGLSINYIKVAPASGISFLVYESLKEFFVDRNKDHL